MTAALVTGLGIVAPNGLGVQQFWDATVAGTGAIAPITRFDSSGYLSGVAGEIHGFDAADHLPGRLLPQTDRMTQLALVAADWALADAGIIPAEVPDYDIGVMTASAAGGFEFGQRELQNLWSRGGQFVSAYQSFAWFYAVNSGQISIRNGLRGPSAVVVADQAGGLDAIAQGCRQIRKGTGAIVTGGVEASICPWGWVGQQASRRLTVSADPKSAYQPFDAGASGHVPGEGGAILIVESAARAQARGARSYGEIAGHAATFDPDPTSAQGLRKAIELAIAGAGSTPGEVDVVFADAAGVPELDHVEAEAISAIFGPGAVAVTAPKTMTGRLASGGAALDVATALLAMADGRIPPTINVEPNSAYGIDLVVDHYRAATMTTALVIARGYGGFNSAMVLRAGNPGHRPAHSSKSRRQEQ
ncbi:ketosynthase chain-length factor [Nocardia sp. NPDC055053]